MIYDELLEELNYAIHEYDKAYDNTNYYYSALRAVVELHKPKDFMVETDFPWVGCWECEELYPCPTIKAIGLF